MNYCLKKVNIIHYINFLKNKVYYSKLNKILTNIIYKFVYKESLSDDIKIITNILLINNIVK